MPNINIATVKKDLVEISISSEDLTAPAQEKLKTLLQLAISIGKREGLLGKGIAFNTGEAIGERRKRQNERPCNKRTVSSTTLNNDTREHKTEESQNNLR